MAEHVHARPGRPDHAGQIGGQVGVAVAPGPEALAVVAHVHRHDQPVGGQPACDDTPVARRPEEAMRDQKRGQGGWRTEDVGLYHGP